MAPGVVIIALMSHLPLAQVPQSADPGAPAPVETEAPAARPPPRHRRGPDPDSPPPAPRTVPPAALPATPPAAEPDPAQGPQPVGEPTSADSRARAVMALRAGQQRDTQAVPALTQMLEQDPNPEVRIRAAWALGQVGGPDGVAPLVGALRRDPARRVRQEAARSLGLADTPRARSALAAALEDPDALVAATSAQALGGSASPAARRVLAHAAQEPRALVRQAAARALEALPNGASRTAQPQTQPPPPPIPCHDENSATPCTPRQTRSAGGPADAAWVAGASIWGGLMGALAPDILRPQRRGFRYTPKATQQVVGAAPPLERAILAALGAGLGAAVGGAYTLVDDLTPTRVGLAGLGVGQGVAAGAASALAFGWQSHQAWGGMLMLGVVGGVAQTAMGALLRDLSESDLVFVMTQGVMAGGAAGLVTLAVVPRGVGRPRGQEGYIQDLGDLWGTDQAVFPLPWGRVHRLALASAAGLAAGSVISALGMALVPFVEPGVGRSLAALAAAALAAGLVYLPLTLVPVQPPAPLPTTDRVGAGLAVAAGMAAGGTALLLYPTEHTFGGGWLGLELPWTPRHRPKANPPTPVVTLAPPTLGLWAPKPVAASQVPLDLGTTPGLYVGLIQARFR